VQRGRYLQAPVPARVAELLERLVGGVGAFHTVAEVRAALADLEGQPTRITRALRSAHLALLATLLVPLLLVMFVGRYVLLGEAVHHLHHLAGVADRALAALDDAQAHDALEADLRWLRPDVDNDPAQWRLLLQRRQQEVRHELERWTDAVNDDMIA